MWVCHFMSHEHTSHEIMRVCRLMSHQNMSHNQRQTGSLQQFCMSSAWRFCVRTWGPYGGALPSAASGGRHAALQCGHGARREARGRAPSPGAHLELRHLRRSALQPSHRGLPPLPRLWRARPCGTGGLDISARQVQESGSGMDAAGSPEHAVTTFSVNGASRSRSPTLVGGVRASANAV